MINIQNDGQLSSLGSITVASVSLADAQSVIGQRVLLYGTRGCSKHGYFATAKLLGVSRDPQIDSRVVVTLSDREDFPRVVPFGIPENELQEERLARGTPPWPLVIGLRLIAWRFYEAIIKEGFADDGASFGVEEEDTRSNELAEPPQLPFERSMEQQQREALTRFRRARDRGKVLRRDGPACHLSHAVFDLTVAPSFLDVSHLHPIGHGGPDVTANMVLMRKEVHAAWENGFVTVEPDGRLLLRRTSRPLSDIHLPVRRGRER